MNYEQIDPPDSVYDTEALILEAARECAESPENDKADRDYLAGCIGRNATPAEWALFVRIRTAAVLKIADEKEADRDLPAVTWMDTTT